MPSTPSRPNIVVISIDTLRADFFSEEHMPRTRAWARDNAVVFTNAYSNSTWTNPSFATLYTGLSQQELAGRVSATRQTINAIEQEKYSPSLELAFRIALAFEVPFEEVFKYAGEDKR